MSEGHNLAEFLATIGSDDLARQNRFEVEIMPPHGFPDRIVNMLCENATFPGQNMRTTPDQLRYGPVREFVHGVTYGPINLTFMCRPGLPEKVFFQQWQALMFNRHSWNVHYYEDYKGEIKVHQLDRTGMRQYSVTIYEAYPKTITAQDYTMGSNDAYQTLQIEFGFHHWDSMQMAGGNTAVPAGAVDDFSGMEQADAARRDRDAAANVDDFSSVNTNEGGMARRGEQTGGVDSFSSMPTPAAASKAAAAGSRSAAAANTKNYGRSYASSGVRQAGALSGQMSKAADAGVMPSTWTGGGTSAQGAALAKNAAGLPMLSSRAASPFGGFVGQVAGGFLAGAAANAIGGGLGSFVGSQIGALVANPSAPSALNNMVGAITGGGQPRTVSALLPNFGASESAGGARQASRGTGHHSGSHHVGRWINSGSPSPSETGIPILNTPCVTVNKGIISVPAGVKTTASWMKNPHR